jgi:hypothetical protein
MSGKHPRAYRLRFLILGLLLAVGLAALLWPRAQAQGPEPDPQPVVTISSSSYTVGEADGTVTITVTLSASSSSTVTVDYATSDGTATDGSDYVGTSGTLTFDPQVTTRTIVIEIIDNLCCESNKAFTVILSNPTHATLGTPSSSTVTILDDDTCP